MSLKKISIALAAVAAMTLVTGCAKAPQVELDAAKASIEAAKAAEADKYVAASFQAANDSLNAASAEIQKQNAAFALSRNYTAAKSLLAAATKIADESKNAAATEKEKVKAEAETALTTAQAALAEARTLLGKAPKGKEGKEALAAMSDELTAVETSLTEASAVIAAGDYMGAKDKIAAGQQKIMQITEELNAAIAKTK